MKKKILLFLLALALLFVLSQVWEPAPAVPVSGEGLTVHFIDVGQADAILLECGGEFMLVDGGNRDDSQLMVSYLQQQGVEKLKAVVCTHPHEDHVGGLPAVLAVFPAHQVLAPTRTYASSIYDKFLYYTDQQGLEVTIPAPGDRFTLGQAQVEVLGPVKAYAETNSTSIVLRVTYGENAFLLTGDMEAEAERDMLDAGAQVRADVLKVGHHGSNSSTSYRFLYEVEPEYAVISVGEGNSYGHPHREPMDRLDQAGVTVLRTDRLGTIVARSDGKTVTFTWEDQSVVPENAEPAREETYVGNKNSHVFHSPGCRSLPGEKNQVIFGSYEEAVEAGYRPCGSCLGS